MKRVERYFISALAIGAFVVSVPARQILIGPDNPGAEEGMDG